MEVIFVFLIVAIWLVITKYIINKSKKEEQEECCNTISAMPEPGIVRRPIWVKYNIQLTMKAIIRTEQMLSKPFVDIDYSNPDELSKLLYCCVLANNSVAFTYEEFQAISENETQLSTMLKEIEKANLVLSQFSGSQKESVGDNAGSPQYVKDLVGTLIMAGLDAKYAMNEMELSDIPVYIEAYEKRKREEMEASRLWTFLNVAPHIDTKKIKSAKNLILFPWEEEETRKLAEEALTRDREMAERFFKEGMNMFKQPSN